MGSILKLIVKMINYLHDYLNHTLGNWIPSLTDKDLHFIIIGIIGLFIFVFTDFIFKKLAKFNISIISVIYTFTVLIVIVFSIEIEQKITKRGNMEFADIVAGLWGFVVIVGAYILIKVIFHIIYRVITKNKQNS